MPSENIILSGFGGQGIVAAGRTIAYAGMKDGNAVSMLPSYGPEMRGGFANCSVILSESEIASPVISLADVVIAMSQPAAEKFESKVKPGKTMIIDSHQIKRKEFRRDIQVIEIPATKIAMDIGNVKFSNMVMIGALMAAIRCPSVGSMSEAVKDFLPKGKESLFQSEMDALYEGMEFVKQYYQEFGKA